MVALHCMTDCQVNEPIEWPWVFPPCPPPCEGGTGPVETQSVDMLNLPYNLGEAIVGPPAAGEVLLNDADPTLATSIFIAGTTAGADNVQAEMLSKLWIGTKIFIRDATDPNTYIAYTAGPAIAAPGGIEVGVTYLGANGALAGPPVNVTLDIIQ